MGLLTAPASADSPVVRHFNGPERTALLWAYYDRSSAEQARSSVAGQSVVRASPGDAPLTLPRFKLVLRWANGSVSSEVRR